LYQEGPKEFCLGSQKSCQAFFNPGCRVHYVQIEESRRGFFVPISMIFFSRNAPGPFFLPGRSHDDKVEHIYQTWYKNHVFYDSPSGHYPRSDAWQLKVDSPYAMYRFGTSAGIWLELAGGKIDMFMRTDSRNTFESWQKDVVSHFRFDIRKNHLGGAQNENGSNSSVELEPLLSTFAGPETSNCPSKNPGWMMIPTIRLQKSRHHFYRPRQNSVRPSLYKRPDRKSHYFPGPPMR